MGTHAYNADSSLRINGNILSFFIKVQALKIAALVRLEIGKNGKSAENAKTMRRATNHY